MSTHKLGYPNIVDGRYRQVVFGFGLGSVLFMITEAMAALMAIRGSRVFYFLNNKDKRFLYEWF